MANIRQIKRRIKSAQNTSKITKAMEMVAASKMMRAQQKAIEARPYAQALHHSLQTVAAHTDRSSHPLLQQHGEGRPAIVVFSTDKGLCGSLNANLMKATWNWKNQQVDPIAIAVGKKGAHFLRLLGIEIFAQFNELPENPSSTDLLPISQVIMENFLNKNFYSVDLLYTDFINTLSQKVKMSPLLPLGTLSNLEDSPESIRPVITKEYRFEPNVSVILNQLVPFYVENTVYQASLEANASEHSARMVAMKNASENAKELVSELQLDYNKQRQAAITSELLDITTAMMSLSN